MSENKFIKKYGNPFPYISERDFSISTSWRKKFEPLHMEVLRYPSDIKKYYPTLGESVYMNKDFVPLYLKFLNKLVERNLHTEITVNDQCFMPRLIRGSDSEISIHSWGMAVDLNPINNPLGINREQATQKGLKPFTANFQEVSKICGLVAGYFFKRVDGMHFEHSNWTI